MIKGNFVFMLLFVDSVMCFGKQDVTSYMDAVADMVKNAKLKVEEAERNCSQSKKNPMDCADLLIMGYDKSGRYSVWPASRLFKQMPLNVYCDMDTDGGGWTVIQRRGNYSRSKDYFYKDWKSYKVGFGNKEEDFWLGNDNIFALTNQKMYSLRFDLENWMLEKRYAQYDNFWIDDEFHNYTLHISGFKGNAGDSMETHNEYPFSTKDRDNDDLDYNCAIKFEGAWWYSKCYTSSLNSQYARYHTTSSIRWNSWTRLNDSLRATEMKIRPEGFTFSNRIN